MHARLPTNLRYCRMQLVIIRRCTCVINRATKYSTAKSITLNNYFVQQKLVRHRWSACFANCIAGIMVEHACNWANCATSLAHLVLRSSHFYRKNVNEVSLLCADVCIDDRMLLNVYFNALQSLQWAVIDKLSRNYISTNAHVCRQS